LHSWYIRTHECLFYVFGRYGRDVIPYLYPMLQHKDPYVRRNAAIVLGYFMDKAAKPALLKMLEANDVGSGGAAFALGQLGDQDVVKPIAAVLANKDARTRFWVAYALYELGSKDAVPALETAVGNEKDETTRGEMTAAIKYLKSEPKPFGSDATKLTKEELQAALAAAKKANGLQGDMKAIAASAGSDDLEQLEAIRLKAMDVPSDKGNRAFTGWTQVIRAVRRRVE
jgi:HEAT repeat protein